MADRTKENIEMLDEIDFSGFFSCSESISNLMLRIEKEYNGTEFTNNDVMQGDVFNWVDQWDLCEYLKNRYPEKFTSYEVTEMYYYID